MIQVGMCIKNSNRFKLVTGTIINQAVRFVTRINKQSLTGFPIDHQKGVLLKGANDKSLQFDDQISLKNKSDRH